MCRMWKTDSILNGGKLSMRHIVLDCMRGLTGRKFKVPKELKALRLRTKSRNLAMDIDRV